MAWCRLDRTLPSLVSTGSDAIAQGLQRLAVGGFHAVQHRHNLRIGGGAPSAGTAARAARIVGNAHHVAGEFGHRILGGFVLLPLGAAADIFRLARARRRWSLRTPLHPAGIAARQFAACGFSGSGSWVRFVSHNASTHFSGRVINLKRAIVQ
jgi:hypothetical protein